MARRAAATGLLLVAFVVTGFVVNAGIRLSCYDGCGADIARLYEDRGIDRAHPPYVERDVEYPPVIGLVMWAAALPVAHGLRWKFVFNALVLTSLAALTTWMLWRRYGLRTRRWALAPPLILQGLTNWDLLAVAPATIGLLQWESGSALIAGLLVGVGAAAKLCPALYVPILAASCVPTRAWRRARDVLIGAFIGAGLFVIPVYAAAPSALRFFLDFHGTRAPIRGAIWFYVFRTPAMHPWLSHARLVDLSNVITSALVIAAVVAIAYATARRRLTPVAACGLATIAFILSNKIYSPQYDLWVLPFLVMVPVRGRIVAHFYVSSTLVWLFTASENHFLIHRPWSLYLLLAAVIYRLVTLGRIAADLMRARPDTEPDIDLTSHPPTSDRSPYRLRAAPVVR
jgi:hypothetical protein